MTSIALSVVVEARRWLGTPYLHQASECGVGADCLGLLRGVWRGVIGPELDANALKEVRDITIRSDQISRKML